MTYTLRDLPLPVKVVATVFLLAVGLGYSSAMVQLHMQDSKSGKPMPTVDDVIKKYTGKVKCTGNEQPAVPMSRLEALVMGPENMDICALTMAPAFTTEDKAKGDLKFANAIKDKTAQQVEAIRAERKGEQKAFSLWINTPDDQRKTAYEADRFEMPADKMPAAITPAFKDGNAIRIKSIIDNRCVTCHEKNSGFDKAESIPLDTYAELAKHMEVSAAVAPAAPGEYVKVEEPISITKLTQSTHAHLLSWAVLFSLTGLIFAFSSYPTSMRCILGPFVVIAVFADVSLWWLARLSDQWGPYFAMGIIGTGAAAGLGLGAQILLSLFNMYGIKGKIVLLALFLLGGSLGLMVFLNKIEPALREKMEATRNPKPHPVPKDVKGANNGKNPIVPKIDDKKYPLPALSPLEDMLAFPVRDAQGQPVPFDQIKFVGGEGGNMTRAFFDKDKHFMEVWADPKVPQAEKDKLLAEREGEIRALVEWTRSKEPDRKAAYDADSFALPGDLGRPVTAKFLKDGKLQVKAIIADRCLKCHGPEGKQYDDYPLDEYKLLAEYLKPYPPPEPKEK